MDLTCNESVPLNSAPKDNNIFRDDRVLANLLGDEGDFTPKFNYFERVQTDIEPFMRKIVATWMLEVCEEQMCEDQILPLAVNIMDRFLCVCDIKKQQFQLLGATCLLIASKIRSTSLLPVDLLCAYTEYSITYEMVISWELLVLSKLDWNTLGITGFDFIDQILERCDWGNENGLLRRHAHTLVSICYTEPALVEMRPSAIAAACLCSAVRGLKMSSGEQATIDCCRMLNVLPNLLENLVQLVDGVVEKVVPTTVGKVVENSTPEKNGYESPPYPHPETPTEVDTIYF